MLSTLVHDNSVSMGSLSVLYNPSHVYDPLQAHVYGRDESKGIMEKPMNTNSNMLGLSKYLNRNWNFETVSNEKNAIIPETT